MITTGRQVVSARSLVEDTALPEHEAVRLLESASGRDRSSLIRDGGLSTEEVARFEQLAARRRSGEPLQYIEGTVQFGPIDVAVDPRVLIPRPETEQLWELVTTTMTATPPKVVLDIGTGSGVLAIAIKTYFPDAAVHAVDVSASALAVAQGNVDAAGCDVVLYQGDLFEPLPAALLGAADLIISNPPYIATTEHDKLPAEVRDHEPPVALFGGPDGLDVLRRLIAGAPEWLAPAGVLACEIGEDQGPAVAVLAAHLSPQIIQDHSGRDRFLIAQKGSQ